MSAKDVIRMYFDAWNRRDMASLLALMHPGAAYYDAFWMESCAGNDLVQYFKDSMSNEPYWYELIGEPLITSDGVVSRYSAHECTDAGLGKPLLYGAEVLTLRDDKILTVTDIYCSPVQSDLVKVAELAAKRHGLTRYVSAGLGALKEARIRARLSTRIEEERVFLRPDLTMVALAEMIDCTVEQLSMVIAHDFGAEADDFVDSQRVTYAKDMLTDDPRRGHDLEQVAADAGFATLAEFTRKFEDFVGVSPSAFCAMEEPGSPANGKSNLH